MAYQSLDQSKYEMKWHIWCKLCSELHKPLAIYVQIANKPKPYPNSLWLLLLSEKQHYYVFLVFLNYLFID